MAVLDIFRPVAPVQSVGGRIVSNLTAVVAIVTEIRAARATAKQLSMMTDRELSDIGLDRGDIGLVARRAVR